MGHFRTGAGRPGGRQSVPGRDVSARVSGTRIAAWTSTASTTATASTACASCPTRRASGAIERTATAPEMDGREGAFACVAPSAGQPRPGACARHLPLCICRRHAVQPDRHDLLCLGAPGRRAGGADAGRRLADAPFNKMRMCVFPKHYRFNQNEPPTYPFEGAPLTRMGLHALQPGALSATWSSASATCATWASRPT